MRTRRGSNTYLLCSLNWRTNRLTISVSRPWARMTRHGTRQALDSLCIYRRLRWGKLPGYRAHRQPQLPQSAVPALGLRRLPRTLPLNTVELVAIADGGIAYSGGQPPATLPYGDGTAANPARQRPPGSMLGIEQREWLLDALASSDATWKLWGNALPLIPMRLDTSSLPFNNFEDSIYSIDGWAGYPTYEISVLMDRLESEGITGVVSLSGDHHMHWRRHRQQGGPVNRTPPGGRGGL